MYSEFDSIGVAAMNKTIIICFGIGAITALEGLALYLGIDGTALAAGIGAIGTLVGYAFGRSQNAETAD